METVFFYIFGIVALASAILVITSRKVFYSALSLILCLCSVAVLYLVLDSPFIAAVQIIVYAGAIMVVFLFVIMLLDPFSSEIIKDKRKYLAYAGVLLGILACTIVYPVLRALDLGAPAESGSIESETASVTKLGETLFSGYLLPFEMTSVLILIAIAGVVVLAKRRTSK